jgi:hypothetical protein
MKHVLWALAASSLLTVTACGNDDGGDPNNNNTAVCDLAIEPTFDSIHDLVLSNTAGPKGCAQASCHGATAFGGLNFTLGKDEVFRQLTQDPVMNPAATVTKRVDTTAENSYLYLRLNSGEMPPGGLDAACADEIKQAVVGWIGTGGGRQ